MCLNSKIYDILTKDLIRVVFVKRYMFEKIYLYENIINTQ